jgi:hypothetical protein
MVGSVTINAVLGTIHPNLLGRTATCCLLGQSGRAHLVAFSGRRETLSPDVYFERKALYMYIKFG